MLENKAYLSVADSDLQIKGGGGGWGGLGGSVWSKDKGVGVGGPPLDSPLPLNKRIALAVISSMHFFDVNISIFSQVSDLSCGHSELLTI